MKIEKIDEYVTRLRDYVPNSLAALITDMEGLVIYSTEIAEERAELIAALCRDMMQHIRKFIGFFNASNVNLVVVRIDNYAFHIFPGEKIIGTVIAKR